MCGGGGGGIGRYRGWVWCVVRLGVRRGCRAAVCVSGCGPGRSWWLWFTLHLHDGGSGLRLGDGPGLKLSILVVA